MKKLVLSQKGESIPVYKEKEECEICGEDVVCIKVSEDVSNCNCDVAICQECIKQLYSFTKPATKKVVKLKKVIKKKK